jgi:hypothetical protein
MSEVVIAESIDNTNDEQIYKYNIDMIDVNTILFNIMNTNTGINYKLHIKKDSEWCNENLYKIQNDFSQLYQMLNDCVNDEDSMFKYTLKEEKEYINFKMEMKKDTKFFKLDLEFKLDRHISENGIIDDRLNSIEYQFNKLRERMVDGSNIKISSGEVIKNDDIYEIYNECNNLVYKGEMKNGKRDGKGIEYCSQTGEIIYEGYFKEGYYEGDGKLYYKPNGERQNIYYEGGFKNGLYHGQISEHKKITTKLGEITYLAMETNYNVGVLNGPYKSWELNELNFPVLKLESHYLNGLTHGTYISYDESGMAQPMNFKYGKCVVASQKAEQCRRLHQEEEKEACCTCLCAYCTTVKLGHLRDREDVGGHAPALAAIDSID